MPMHNLTGNTTHSCIYLAVVYFGDEENEKRICAATHLEKQKKKNIVRRKERNNSADENKYRI